MASSTLTAFDKDLPLTVRAALEKMDEKAVSIFCEMYGNARKNRLSAYLWLIFLSPIASLAYLQRYGLLWVFILVTVLTVGFGGLAWVLFELVFTGKRVRTYNAKLATRLLHEQKMLMV